jgi:hypothetical protein
MATTLEISRSRERARRRMIGRHGIAPAIGESLEHPRGRLHLDRLTQWGLRLELLVLAMKRGEVADRLE